jgi:hypothetical protein
MAYCNQIALPTQEPVSLTTAKAFLNLPSSVTTFDAIISGFIQGAREDGERISGRCLAQRQFLQVMDSFPYFADTVQSQLAYPPSYYSLPRYSTTLWNYSQMIKMMKSPLISVDTLTYIDDTGNPQTLQSGVDFIVDPETELARVFPMVGQYWPPCLYTPNAVAITFTAGYDPDPTATQTIGLPSPPPNPPNQQTEYTIVVGIPQVFLDAMLNLIAYRFNNRGSGGEVPPFIERAFQANGLIDFSPTRG